MKKRFLDILFAITHPSYWHSNHVSLKSYDTWLNEQMDNKVEITFIDQRVAKLGNTLIWTSNYPYAFGCRWGKSEILPYRRTRRRLLEYINDPKHFN